MSEATGDVLDRFCAGDDPEGMRRDAAELLVSNFASYGIDLLDGEDAERLQAAWDEDSNPSAVVRSLPIKRVAPHIREMLDYYRIRKVIGPAGVHGPARRHLRRPRSLPWRGERDPEVPRRQAR